MPPKLPLISKAVTLLSLPSRTFVCASCRYSRCRTLPNGLSRSRIQGKRKAHGGTILQTRKASTTASVTAVNVKHDIPPRFLNLHESLKALETEAAVYINPSQLRLASRGLESENAVTRIAGNSSRMIVNVGVSCSLKNSAGSEWAQWTSEVSESPAGGSLGVGATVGEAAYGRR